MDYDLFRLFTRVERKLDLILKQLGVIYQEELKMAGELQALEAQVKKNTDAEQSAIVLLQGLKAALDAAIASGDPTRLKDLSDQLGTSQAALAAAVLANTPTP